MDNIACKTVLNWRFYIGFPILMASLLIALFFDVVSMPCKVIYKQTKKCSELINYSKSLKKLANWTFRK